MASDTLNSLTDPSIASKIELIRELIPENAFSKPFAIQ